MVRLSWSTKFIMNLNVENLVRSAVVLVVALPISITAAFSIAERPRENESVIAQADLKAQLTVPCLRYALSKNDSKLEREAKNAVDEVLGGEVNYQEACKWVLS